MLAQTAKISDISKSRKHLHAAYEPPQWPLRSDSLLKYPHIHRLFYFLLSCWFMPIVWLIDTVGTFWSWNTKLVLPPPFPPLFFTEVFLFFVVGWYDIVSYIIIVLWYYRRTSSIRQLGIIESRWLILLKSATANTVEGWLNFFLYQCCTFTNSFPIHG